MIFFFSPSIASYLTLFVLSLVLPTASFQLLFKKTKTKLKVAILICVVAELRST